MRANFHIAALSAVLAVFTLSLITMTTDTHADQDFAPGRILVKPQAGVSKANFHALLNRFGARSQSEIPQLGIHVVELPPQADERAFQALMSRRADVKFAELDYRLEPIDFIVNDPNFGSQWHLPKVQASAAWDLARGAGVTVAILDTGVDGAHPDLAQHMVPGWNVYDNNSDTSDVHGHGTSVAGTAAAHMNNGVGVSGVAGEARIMPVRISDLQGYAYWSTVAKAITWAADNGADVANVSYMAGGSLTVDSAAKYFRDKGGLTTIAAGNDGQLASTMVSGNTIIVSATTSTDTRASWSNYGDFVDVSAPGSSIYTTRRGGGYGSVSGTSFSAPMTAGVVALIKSANPALTPTQVENILFSSADDIGSAGYDMYYGHGRVNASRAVLMAMDTQAVDTQAPSVDIVSPAEGEDIAGDVLVQVGASDNVGVTRVDLFIDGGFFASSTEAPFTFFWDTAIFADGTRSLMAKAFDAAGNSRTSAVRHVTLANQPVVEDITAPVVNIDTPSDGSSVSGNVFISATATDNVGVRATRLFIDGSLEAESLSGSVTKSWNTRKLKGPHTITAEAEDFSGLTAVHTITVTVGSTDTGGTDKPGNGKGRK